VPKPRKGLATKRHKRHITRNSYVPFVPFCG
jgi:hypothetical protein